VVQNSKAYSEGFDKGELPMPPAKKLAVVACMDARLDPNKVLGLNEGDAHVIRNAGGVITDDQIRSLAISQRLLGTEEIVLIHHTDCGMLTFRDDEFKATIEEEVGIKPTWAPESFSTSRRSPPVARAHPGEPVHPAQGVRARASSTR
jgi:carbonic anhydrase